MKLVVGLGNPGDKYSNSRHNVGFMVVDDYAQKVNGRFVVEKDFSAEICRVKGLIIMKPQTFMNASGAAVARASNFYKIKPLDIWVINDDIDIVLGKLKIRLGGAAAGHHGVESIMSALGTDKFYRFRVGIGRPDNDPEIKYDTRKKEVSDYVISDFSENEIGDLKKTLKKASTAIGVALERGMERAMNEYNG